MSTASPPDEQALMRKAILEIRELRARLGSLERAKAEPIAVVGMGCRFPGAPDPAAFWELLCGGKDAVTEVPKDRWDVDEYFDADPEKPGKMYTRWGGFLKQIEEFSPAFFGISPREAAAMDPQQRLLLEVSWEALEDAALAADRLQDRRVGVFVGVGATDYSELEVLQGPAAIDAYNGTGTSFSVASGRLSYVLGVRGPSLAVDTACSSSLTSVHLAVLSLRNRESDVALAGGVNLMMSPDSLVSLCKARMLSPDGRCKTFDAGANGYVRGEGCGVVVLKRLADALADRHDVLAVIRGSGINHNGRSSGLTVPSGPAQQALIRGVLEGAGLKPSDVSYVEAHGTGTAVGDPIEVGALASVFADRARPLLVSSVKSNVGHLEWAAGICGLIKVILSLRHGQVPPSLHVKQLNPRLEWDTLPLRVVTELTPWPKGPDGPRRAGVSSFGFGGTNAHVVIEEPPAVTEPAAGEPAAGRPVHVFVLSAKSPQALAELAGRHAAFLKTAAASELANVCHTAGAGRSHFEHRLATVVASTEDLRQRLDAVARGEQSADVASGRAANVRPRVAMLFTGQGSQYPGMGRELYETEPVFRDALRRCDKVLRAFLAHPLLEFLYDAGDAQQQLIHQTAYTQPALFAIEYALAQCWQSWGIRPEVVMGHSTGEFAAACVAGVFGLEDGLKLIAERGRLMQALPAGGAMLAVRAPEDRVKRAIAADAAAVSMVSAVSIAAVNGPSDVVLSGERRAVDAVAARLQAEGVATQPLTVWHAFHSPLMEPMLAEFERVAATVRYSPPSLAMISTVTGRRVGADVADPSYWVRHVRESVHFTAGMAALSTEGCEAILEVGPKPVLMGMGRQCLPDADAAWLPSLRPGRGDTRQMLESLGALYVRGADIDWAGFDRGRPPRKLNLPTYPFERQHYPLPKSDRRSRARGAQQYPLVETLVRSPLVKETVFATPFGTAEFPWLADHRIFGEVVAPAGCYLAMMLNGARRLGHAAASLGDVFFVAPLALKDREERTLQAVLEPEGGFRIISFPAAAAPDDVVSHVSGRLTGSPGPAAAAAPVAPAETDHLLDEARARCTNGVNAAVLSAGLEGIEFGPSFRWIEALWTGRGEVLACLRRPDAVGDADGYWLHPGLLDACFQVAGATLQAETAGDVWLPFGVKRLDVVAPAAGKTCWCHASQVGEGAWDVRLFDESGRAIAEVQRFEMRRATGDAFRQRRTADWLYRVQWQPMPLRGEAVPGHELTWLVVDQGSGLGAEVVKQLTGRGQFARLAPADSEAAGALVESHDGVVYLCGANDAADDVASAAESATVGLVHLARSIARGGSSGSMPRLRLVTLGSQAVADADTVQPASAPLWGLARTLQLELPALSCACVDLPRRPSTQDFEALIAELSTASAENQVAYRSGERYVARLVRHADVRAAEIDGPFRLQLAEYGSPDQLRLAPMSRRAPGRGEVEIEVRAAALNFRDVLISLGMLKDYYRDVLKIGRAQDVRLGFDCAGVVAAVGEGVTDFQVGDEVMTSAAGSSASFLTLPRTDVVHKPAGTSFEEAAAIPTAFFTAHYGLLQLAKLKPGERVLIHSAAGGVGQAAVQLAQAAGAEVFATASPGKWDFLRNQGVPHVMNSRTLDFAEEVSRLTGGEGVDVVLNSLTGQAIDKSFDVLRQGGRFVEIGKLGIWTAEQAKQRRPDVAYFTFDLDQEIDKDAGLPHRTLGEVRRWFEGGRLRPLPRRVYSVYDAVEAYRFLQHTRQVGKVVLSFVAGSEPPVRADGSYLITGGLGGLGLKVAGKLVEQGARHLVLAGRSDPSEEATAAIAALRFGGATVEVARADVANPADVASLIAGCQAHGPLRGVVHAAGVLDDGVFERQTAERFLRVLGPKVRGALNLHAQTCGLALDFFVCFSSMASVLGSAGQSNYSAANAFLDALAHHRRACGLPALSINWGPWAEVGMAARLPVAGQGVEKLEVADALQVLGDLLQPARRWGPAQVGVWRANWPAFQKRLPPGDPPPFLGALVRKARQSAPRPVASDEFLRRFHQAPVPDRPGLLESTIQSLLSTVLGLQSSDDVVPTRPWAELGLDSLMMVDLKTRLETMLRLTLPVEKMVRDVDTRTMASFIVQKLNDAAPPDAGAIPAPADAASAKATGGIGGNREKVLSEDDIQKLALEIPQMFVTADKQNGRQVLVGGRWRHDFASCNYLGMDFHPEVIAAIPPALAEWGVHPSWTRAVASPRIYDDLERELAQFVGAPTTLVFPSISLLHHGVLPMLAGFDGVILRDTESHHTIHEACLRAQANGAEWVGFPHSDIADLERKLSRYRPGRTKIIATDGVYSMGSSHPPLVEYARLAREYNATLYVDDAHGMGIIGERPDEQMPYGYRGNGIVRHFGLDYVADRIVYVAGLSKSFSSYAAFVTCFDEKMKWNLQGSGPFVFSGPTCVASLASALAGLRVNAGEGDQKRRDVYRMTRRFVTAVRETGYEVDNASFFPVIGVVIGSFEDLVRACKILWEHDILITPAFYPAVPLDRNLVRFSITAVNTDSEVEDAVRALRAVRESLGHPNNGTLPRSPQSPRPDLVAVS